MNALLVALLLLPLFGLTFIQRRKWALGPATGLKTFFGGRLMPTQVVDMAISSATVVAVGDGIYVAANKALPATSAADSGTLAANQQAFHNVFLGFALEPSANGSTTPIAVATAGIMIMDAAAATFEVGDLVGLSEDAGGTFLLNTTGIGVAAVNLSIGRCCERGTTVTQVKVDFNSTVMYGGLQAKV